MANNLNSYSLPSSMTPDRPTTTVRSGNNVNEELSLSESWTRRLAKPLGGGGRNESQPRRSSPSSSSSDNGNDYQPPTTDARTSSHRTSFDIEQQEQSAVAASTTTKRRSSPGGSPTAFLRAFPSKNSSSSGTGSRKENSGSRKENVIKSPFSSTPSPSRKDDDNDNSNNFRPSPSTSSVPPTPLSPPSPSPSSPPSPSPSPPQSPTPDISQSFSTGKSTYTLQSRRHKGFSTPFCGLFTTSGGLPTADHEHPQLHHQEDLNHHKRELQLSHLRTDICSLPCFGLLQADHTRYLFTHTRPPTFFKRICTHFITPVTLFLVAGYCAGNIRNEYVNSVVCTGLVYCIVIWIVSGCVRGRKKRVMVREEILWRLRRREEKIQKRMEERRERLNLRLGGKNGNNNASADGLIQGVESEEYEYYSEDEYEYHKSGYETSLGHTRFEMNCAHRMLGCYPSDIPRDSCCSDGSEADDYVSQQQQQRAEDFNPDLCTRIWSCFAKPCLPCVPWCCGDSYGFHPQFCGLCALAQEAREANLTLPRHLRMVDYITMEPFLLYYPRIVELRRSATNSFWAHCRAISALSRTLLVSLKIVIVTLLIVSVSSAFGYWELNDMMVLLTTFLQSFAVMYVVHWGWHRYDLSIDAVIKYFACGFVLCTSMAFTVELLEYLAFQGVVMGLVWWLEVSVVDSSGYGGGGMRDAMADGQHGRSLAAGSDVLEGFLKRNPSARIFYILVSSYLMAGLVEEVCKYFGFVMVDHPDFCSEREMEKAKATMPLQLLRDREEDDEGEDEPVENEAGSNENGKPPSSPARVGQAQVEIDAALASFNPAMQRRSLSSIRSGVTVAMVAVALGFACCENILQIFIYNRSSLRSEITTLIVKSLFPVHPIAAAIQSIYVCRRDLEKDPSIGLGRIVLPSVIFHGTYDFVLLLVTSSWQRSNNEAYLGQGNNLTGVAVLSFCASLFMVLAGGLYYMFSSRAQYARLRGDSGRGNSSVLPEASFGLLL